MISLTRLVISFIILPTIDSDSNVAFTLGSITRRIIIIPPIHTSVAKRWKKWLKLNINKFILNLPFVIPEIILKGWGS